MPREIYLVKVGMSMTEGMVSEWYIADGATVTKGELVYALETEKVNLDVDAEYDGVVKHLVETGVMLEPGAVVGYIFEAGEAIPDDLTGVKATPGAVPTMDSQEPASQPAQDSSVTPEPARPTPPARSAEESTGGRIKSSPAARRLAGELGIDFTTLAGTGPGGRIVEADVLAASKSATVAEGAAAVDGAALKASPLARRLARERGIDLASVTGTGPGGRIVQADLDAASPRASAPQRAAASLTTPSNVPVKGMRRTIATRMHRSLQESAQLTMNMEALMDDAVKLRSGLIDEWQADGVRPTYTDLVVKAAAKALRLHPMMNSEFTDDEIMLHRDVHVGIAVALPEGLVVPVVRNADQLPMKELAVETSRLATAARDGKLGLDDYAGGTFTVSALGMYGVDSFTPIINSPQSGILGVNRVRDGVAWDGDTPRRVKQMNLSLTWDHRVLDGAPAAEFLVTVREILEAPYRMLV